MSARVPAWTARDHITTPKLRKDVTKDERALVFTSSATAIIIPTCQQLKNLFVMLKTRYYFFSALPLRNWIVRFFLFL